MNTLVEPPSATRTALAFLTRITAKGLKSGDFSHDLERVNIITGRSASGKTARLDAIRLALNGGTLLGRASDLKSRTQDIMDLARDGQIEVMAEDDAGRKIHRRWLKGKNCQVVAQQIPQTADILLDASQYFALSDAKKIEYAFALLNMEDSEQFSRGSICAAVAGLRIENASTETEKVISELLELMRGTAADSIDAKQPVQQWLMDLIQTLKLRLSMAKKTAERMTQTVQGITQLAADAPRNVEKELNAERQKLGQLQTGLMWLEKQKADLEELIRRREAIQKEILEIKTRVNGIDDHAKALAETQKQIADLEAEIARIEDSPLALPSNLAGVDMDTLKHDIERLEAEIKKHKQEDPRCTACGQALTKGIEERQDAISKTHALIAEKNKAVFRARGERDGVLRAKRAEIVPLRQFVAYLESVETKLSAAEARLSELSLDGKPSLDSIGAEITQAKEKKTACELLVAELDRKHRLFIAHKADEQRNAQALIEHGKAKADVEVTIAAIDRLEKIQAEMVATAFESILTTVNRITEGVIKEPIQYRDGVIGRWVGSTFVKHESFSGTEKALTYAGISLALAKDAPVKILLVDELGRLDPVSLYEFICTITQLVNDGVVSQFVGCLSGEFAHRGTIAGVNMIDV